MTLKFVGRAEFSKIIFIAKFAKILIQEYYKALNNKLNVLVHISIIDQ